MKPVCRCCGHCERVHRTPTAHHPGGCHCGCVGFQPLYPEAPYDATGADNARLVRDMERHPERYTDAHV